MAGHDRAWIREELLVADQPRLPGVVPLRVMAWPGVVDGFLGELGDRSENTRVAYRRDLEDWSAWCAGAGVDPLHASRADVARYLVHLERAGRARSTMSRRLCALRGVYGWAAAEDLLERSPVLRVRSPRHAGTPALGLEPIQVVDLLDAARAAGALEYALLCLLVHNGLRVSEACGTDVADLRTVLGFRTIRIRRKGGHEATERLADVTAAAIDAHLAGRRQGPLFSSPTGLRLYRQRARRIVIRLADAVGIPPGVTAHSLRHTFVTQGRLAGASLEQLQDAAGHADPRTTRHYDRARHQLEDHPTELLATYLDDHRRRRDAAASPEGR